MCVASVCVACYEVQFIKVTLFSALEAIYITHVYQTKIFNALYLSSLELEIYAYLLKIV